MTAPSPTAASPDSDGDLEYECVGDFRIDFAAICKELGCFAVVAELLKPAAPDAIPEEGEELPPPRTLTPSIRVAVTEDETPHALLLSGWPLTLLSCKAMMLAVEASGISTLRFNNAGLTDEHITMIIDSFSNNPIRQLHINHNSPENGISQHMFARLMSGNDSETPTRPSTVQKLSLRFCGITDLGALELSKALKNNIVLTSLNLYGNKMTDDGATSLVGALRANRSLRMLSLGRNKIGDRGATELAQVLTEYALTHDETVQRRKLLIGQADAGGAPETMESHGKPDTAASRRSSKTSTLKKGKDSAKKETAKGRKPSGKKGGKGKGAVEEDEVTAPRHPFLDAIMTDEQGRFLCPGNDTLVSISMAGNAITEDGLAKLLAAMNYQEVNSVDMSNCTLRLRLNGNKFRASLAAYRDLLALMAKRDPYFSEPAEECEGA